MGLLAGLWAILGVARWLGDHWTGVQPVLAFAALRWIVAALAGMAVASLFQWWGDQLGRAVQAGPAAWADRGGGLAIGVGVGFVTAALAMMVALLAPQPRGLAEQASLARATVPLMASAVNACSLSARFVPGGPWLEERFRKAHRRAEEARRGAPRARARGV